ncbi:MAG: nucleotidyl transferase [Rhodospirillaceae bacterium]|nr:nucleotidyl transferase [Rhodospirillaceae bacterium]
MTRALILAAGKGERLRPLTDDKPKCLVPLLGMSLLERQAATLRGCGIDTIHVATGYRGDQIEALGFETSHNARYAETNMVESLFSARAFMSGSTEDLIIGYGDIVYAPRNLSALLASNADIALMVDRNWRAYWDARMDNPLDDAETMLIDPSGHVTELGKKPENYDQIQAQYTGLIKVRGDRVAAVIEFYDALDRDKTYDDRDFYNMYMTSFLQLLIDANWPVEAVRVDNGWLEVDTVEDLKLYESMAAAGELVRFYDARPA